jgi:hypothetical protein
MGDWSLRVREGEGEGNGNWNGNDCCCCCCCFGDVGDLVKKGGEARVGGAFVGVVGSDAGDGVRGEEKGGECAGGKMVCFWSGLS